MLLKKPTLTADYKRLAKQAFLNFAIVVAIVVCYAIFAASAAFVTSVLAPIILSIFIVTAGWALALGIWRAYAVWLYVKKGGPRAKVVGHWTRKENVKKIELDRELRPGTHSTNLGSAVYVIHGRYPVWTNVLSFNERFPFIHYSPLKELVEIKMRVQNPDRLIWNSRTSFAVRGSIKQIDGEFVI